ncbi:bursicon-like [Littorina saxatilis]|uniref:bursicon-like n=1 Tax=Littorina saxatilis TaxID=31220 RepID=UPI0038B5F9C5
MATFVSPFLYYNKRQMMTEPSMFEEEEPEERYRPSRQSSQYPQIGARTSLTEKCQVNPVLITIRPPPRFADRCDPRTVVSYGCRGGCSSYTRVDVRNTTNLLRSCSCCSPTGFGFRIVRMTCQNFGLRSLVKFALGCHCRPCLASVESADVQTLRDLLRKSSLLT